MKLRTLATARFQQLLKKFEEELVHANKRLIYFGRATLDIPEGDVDNEPEGENFSDHCYDQELYPADGNYVGSVEHNPYFDEEESYDPDARHDNLHGAFGLDNIKYVDPPHQARYVQASESYAQTVKHRRQILRSIATIKHALELAQQHFEDDDA